MTDLELLFGSKSQNPPKSDKPSNKTPAPDVTTSTSSRQEQQPERTESQQTSSTKIAKTSKLANQQTSKGENQAGNKSAIESVSPTPFSNQPHDPASLTTKEKKKYGTYLTVESIQKIRIRAAETNKDSHQLLQEIVNQYFEKLAN